MPAFVRVNKDNAKKDWPIPKGGWCKACIYDEDGFPIEPLCNVCKAAAEIKNAPLGTKRKVTAMEKFDATQESPKRKATPKGAPKKSATKASATTKEPTAMTTMSPTVAIGAERLLVLAHGGTGVWEMLGEVDRVDIHRNAKTVAKECTHDAAKKGHLKVTWKDSSPPHGSTISRLAGKDSM